MQLHKIIVNSLPQLECKGERVKRLRPHLEIYGVKDLFVVQGGTVAHRTERQLLYSSVEHVKKVSVKRKQLTDALTVVQDSRSSLHSRASRGDLSSESEFTLDDYLGEQDDDYPVYFDQDFIFFKLTADDGVFTVSDEYNTYEICIMHQELLVCRYEFFPWVVCDGAGLVRISRPMVED